MLRHVHVCLVSLLYCGNYHNAQRSVTQDRIQSQLGEPQVSQFLKPLQETLQLFPLSYNPLVYNLIETAVSLPPPPLAQIIWNNIRTSLAFIIPLEDLVLTNIHQLKNCKPGNRSVGVVAG
jgi:hypothetical protein